jgi:hypothetical protein
MLRGNTEPRIIEFFGHHAVPPALDCVFMPVSPNPSKSQEDMREITCLTPLVFEMSIFFSFSF